MITARRDTEDEGRVNEALILLESSGYVEPWKLEISNAINDGSPAEIDLIIEDLLLNQVDTWKSYRQKDIQRRLNQKC